MPSSLLERQQTAGGVPADTPDPYPPVLHFGDAAAEYEAAHTTAAVFDVSDRVQIELTGRDRVKFLHNFCTNDIKALTPGGGCEAFLTNAKGRILGHVLVFATEHTLWIDTAGVSEESLLTHLDRYIITEDVQLQGRTAEHGDLLVSGPQAVQRIASLSVGDVELGRFEHTAAPLGDSFLAVRRADLLGGTGALVSAPRDSLADVWQTLVDAGCRPAGRQAYAALRIEAGTPLYGVDLTDDNIAQEAARTHLAISFTKGCYLGQEPIARLDALGHTNRELRGLRLQNGSVPVPGTPVFADATEAGRITSAAANPADGQPVALALLKSKHLRAGTELTVGTPEGAIAARVFWPFSA